LSISGGPKFNLADCPFLRLSQREEKKPLRL